MRKQIKYRNKKCLYIAHRNQKRRRGGIVCNQKRVSRKQFFINFIEHSLKGYFDFKF